MPREKAEKHCSLFGRVLFQGIRPETGRRTGDFTVRGREGQGGIAGFTGTPKD